MHHLQAVILFLLFLSCIFSKVSVFPIFFSIESKTKKHNQNNCYNKNLNYLNYIIFLDTKFKQLKYLGNNQVRFETFYWFKYLYTCSRHWKQKQNKKWPRHQLIYFERRFSIIVVFCLETQTINNSSDYIYF